MGFSLPQLSLCDEIQSHAFGGDIESRAGEAKALGSFADLEAMMTQGVDEEAPLKVPGGPFPGSILGNGHMKLWEMLDFQEPLIAAEQRTQEGVA